MRLEPTAYDGMVERLWNLFLLLQLCFQSWNRPKIMRQPKKDANVGSTWTQVASFAQQPITLRGTISERNSPTWNLMKNMRIPHGTIPRGLTELQPCELMRHGSTCGVPHLSQLTTTGNPCSGRYTNLVTELIYHNWYQLIAIINQFIVTLMFIGK